MKVFKKLIGMLQRQHFPIEDLLETIQENDMEQFDWILENRVDYKNINCFNKKRINPLLLACTQRQITFIEKLLQAGANPNFRNFHNETILISVAKQTDKKEHGQGHHWNMDAWDSRFNHIFPDYGAQKRKNNHFEKETLRIIQLLLDYRGDVHAVDMHKNSALINSIKNDYSEVGALLIEKGANPFLKNVKGECALSLCVKKNQDELIENIICRYPNSESLTLVKEFIKDNPRLESIFKEYLTVAERHSTLEETLEIKSEKFKKRKI